MITREHHFAETRDGWRLKVRHSFDPERRIASFRPVVVIPGYGMNNHVIGFHPTGPSMEDYLARAGFDLWSANMRGQEGSVSTGGSRDHGMREVSLHDIGAIVELVCKETQQERVDIVGCSLGGTMVFVHLVLVPNHRIATVIALGAPLRWVEAHPLVGLVFGSEWLARRLRLKYTRAVAFAALHLVKVFPPLLSIYIHPDLVDLSEPRELIKSVEDPNPVMNEELVRWFARRDLVIDGVNITEAARQITNPLLAITGNVDGIVPSATARFPVDWVASSRKQFLEIGDAKRRYSHADLYISRWSDQLVFPPMAEWLGAANG